LSDAAKKKKKALKTMIIENFKATYMKLRKKNRTVITHDSVFELE